MKEKIIKSPGENGEYLLSEDIITNDNGNDVKGVSIFFRKVGMEEWEPFKSVRKWKDAEAEVKNEIAAWR